MTMKINFNFDSVWSRILHAKPRHNVQVKTQYNDEMQYINQCKDGILFEGSRIAVAKPKVSIVIPVYNKVKYLDLALRSAQNQTMRDLEIICVDDGSNDGSIEKIESYIKDDDRIRLVKHEQNAGTLKTRCDGVRAAKGEFIMPLDADDAFCNPKIAELAYTKAKEVCADIVHFSCKATKNVVLDDYKIGNPFKCDKVVVQPELYHSMLSGLMPSYSWGKLIKRDIYVKAFEILGETFLNKGIFNIEDYSPVTTVFQLATKYIGIKDVGYLYSINDISTTSKGFESYEKGHKRIWDVIQTYTKMFEITAIEYKQLLIEKLFRTLKWFKIARIVDYGCAEEFKELAKLFISTEGPSRKNKVRLRAIINDINEIIKNNAKKDESTEPLINVSDVNSNK